jgi:glucosylceramidase
VWLTRGDQSSLLAPQANRAFSSGNGSHSTKITIDPQTYYQTIDGFGAAITDSSAWLIQNELNAAQRDALMAQLFSRENGIGISFVRLPMGASDFALTAYTYDDMPSGQTDPTLANFSIAHDLTYIIPTLLDAMQRNPDLQIMASPWSAPAWMKSSGTLYGGSMQSQYYDEYAQYFVRFIEDYTAAGVPVAYVTPQNEPLNSTTAMAGDDHADVSTECVCRRSSGTGIRRSQPRHQDHCIRPQLGRLELPCCGA